jgi:ADP-dependent phosphofructokinase/glucokinase
MKIEKKPLQKHSARKNGAQWEEFLQTVKVLKVGESWFPHRKNRLIVASRNRNTRIS